MIDSRQGKVHWARPRRNLAVTALLVLVSAAWGYGQDPRPVAPDARLKHASEPLSEVLGGPFALAGPIEMKHPSNGAAWFTGPWNGRRFATPGAAGGNRQQQPPARRPERSTRRKVLGAVVGGVGGFFGGGLLGAMIEGDRCDCDDPGFLGFVIGAPIGATAGGILGYKFLF